jgi:hypothetical protein
MAMNRIERSITNADGESAVLYLHYPAEAASESDEFICVVGMETPNGNRRDRISGLGQMQALYLGMRRLAVLIDIENGRLEQHKRWFWPGGLNEDDFGLPPPD